MMLGRGTPPRPRCYSPARPTANCPRPPSHVAAARSASARVSNTRTTRPSLATMTAHAPAGEDGRAAISPHPTAPYTTAARPTRSASHPAGGREPLRRLHRAHAARRLDASLLPPHATGTT